MKNQECKRLAKISLKNRKKTTRTTVSGIVFGLLLLIPVIFLSLGINNSIAKELNKTPSLLFVDVPVQTDDSDYDDKYEANVYVNYSTLDKEHSQIVDEYEAYGKIVYTTYKNVNNYMSMDEYSTYSIDNGKEEIIPNPNYSDDYYKYEPVFGRLNIVDSKESDMQFFKTSAGNYLLEGYNQGFSENSKGEIYISELLLEYLGLEKDDVYNHTLTIKYNEITRAYDQVVLDNDNNPDNYFNMQDNPISVATRTLFKNYMVVGIINKNYAGYGNGSLFNAGFIATTDSLYYDGTQSIEPQIKYVEYEDNRKCVVATYTHTNEEIEKYSQEYITIGAKNYTNVQLIEKSQYNSNTQESTNKKYAIKAKNIVLFGKNYDDLDNMIVDIANQCSDAYGESPVDGFSSAFASSAYNEFKLINQIFTYVSILFLSVGGIIFFSAMINLFNTIQHSVNSRKNYLGVMRAIGARSSAIPKLYIYEVLVIFAKAMFWIILFGGAICVGLKLGIDAIFARFTLMGIKLSISWLYILITFAIVIPILYLIGWLFAYGSSRRLAKKPITDILEG